ncbi:hypothetical protein PoHVEF18_007040 [Penicillium ochrochloron]
MDTDSSNKEGDTEPHASTTPPHATKSPGPSASSPQYDATHDDQSRIKSSKMAKLESGFTKLWVTVRETLLDSQNDTPTIARQEAELEQARKDIQRLEERLRQQEDEIIRYRSETFRSLNAFEISDRQISDELTSIYMGLSNWVEGLPEPKNGDYNWQEVMQFMGHNGYTVIFNELFATEQAGDTQMELLKHIVCSILWDNIFEPLLVGATEDQNLWLKELCANIRLLQPPKDILEFGKWRSETFRACAKSERYKQNLGKRCAHATNDVWQTLAVAGYSDDEILLAKCHKFHAQIAKPVADFATRLKCSPKDYRWAWEYLSDIVQKNAFQGLDLIDAKTHGQIMKDKFRGLDNDYVIGDYMFTIFPTLHRVRGEDQPDILIGKGSIVVNIHG